jgi:hypothetical protein
MYLHAEILAEKESGRGALGTRALFLKGEINYAAFDTFFI